MGYIIYKWVIFHAAMLNYQRVNIYIYIYIYYIYVYIYIIVELRTPAMP